ncbi:hypothetical protein CALVIDRAFT_195473 [Calocera viscosa TUFC12733]|uniref:F-box domain-containing protein n=1 Tax=Calocera viscosa (strain TUFC12733) TaxID=1330018 RepID=A0A167KGE1_CALVF|nr:hypothetical protein CALVIDRAFT_195473 [Calocera viscosa TUFC12733]
MSATKLTLTDNVVQQRRTPIHRLNADILLHVFTICRDDEPVDIWTLSRVCSRWRSLALEHSFLWTRITVNQPSIDLLGYYGLRNWLDEWILRTGTTGALDVVIDTKNTGTYSSWYWSSIDDFRDMLLAVAREAHRWRSFSYTLDLPWETGFGSTYPWETQSAKQKFLERVRSVPLLRSMCLMQRGAGEFCAYSPQTVYSLLHHDTDLHLSSLSLLNVKVTEDIPRGKLDRFSYQVTPDCSFGREAVLSALKTYSSMRCLHLSGWIDPEDDESSAIVLGGLEELHVEPDVETANILSSVDMPCLAKLTVGGRGRIVRDRLTSLSSMTTRNNSDAIQFLRDFSFRPHSSLLTTLVLNLSAKDVPWSCIASFRSLETLRIAVSILHFSWLTTPRNLSDLWTKKRWDDGEPTWLLPRLQMLILEVDADRGFNHSVRIKWTQLDAEWKRHSHDRWAAAHQTDENIAVLDIDIITSSRKMEVREVARSIDHATAIE